ncbi:hypothetical protein ACOSQ4_012456 [Xanthoceras sorbifolium]
MNSFLHHYYSSNIISLISKILYCFYANEVAGFVLILKNFLFFLSGYMSSEYAMHGEFSVKSDVYSFGVLGLEIITGKSNSSFYQTHGVGNLLSYVSSNK